MNNCAYSLFLATISNPDVSLSILCTLKGEQLINSFVFRSISIIFFLDLVPDWTEIPAGLFITTKLSLLFIKILLEKVKSFLVGI